MILFSGAVKFLLLGNFEDLDFPIGGTWRVDVFVPNPEKNMAFVSIGRDEIDGFKAGGKCGILDHSTKKILEDFYNGGKFVYHQKKLIKTHLFMGKGACF